MKTLLKISFILLTFAVLVLSSCTKSTEDIIDNELDTQTDGYITNRLNELANSNQEVKIESATLEEINQVMVENGLNPFTEREVNDAMEVSSRYTYNCSVWNNLGDWSGNGILSTLDLVLAQQYLCNNASSCNGSLYTGNGDYSSAATDFSWLSGLANGSQWWDLNENDIESGRDLILCRIHCN